MRAHPRPTALIADDEPLLAQALAQALAHAWPELDVRASVGDGASAVRESLSLRPDVLFLDIRMPGLDGLDAAAELAESWAPDLPFPALVFVTAYDRHAVRAFELQALDYLLKPVEPARLQQTVARLRERLRSAAQTEDPLPALRRLLEASRPALPQEAPLSALQVAVGDGIRLVPIEAVIWFEAADKYVRVITSANEYLIRTPLKELLPRLDPRQFWQVHRGTVVRASAIELVERDALGRLALRLNGRTERLPVSRLHAGLFKAM